TPPALRRWAVEVAAGAATTAAALDRLRAELRSWEYDLNAPIADDAPLASFLRLRRGHCELFATTLALAARELGVPARVVNGYYGGEWNEVGGFWLIRQQHAHSWAEVWLDGAWHRYDPTPPTRWSLSGVRLPTLDALWESVRMSWYRYVLSFETGDRARLVRALARALADAARDPALLAALLLLPAAIAARRAWRGGRIRRPGGRRRTDARLLAVLDRWLARRGVRRPPSQPVASLPAPDGIPPAAWESFVREWDARIYGGAPRWRRRELRIRLARLAGD
ncbi:MAG: transglutaminase-like domain-containing protein, partial [Mariprofundaceae bacterium]